MRAGSPASKLVREVVDALRGVVHEAPRELDRSPPHLDDHIGVPFVQIDIDATMLAVAMLVLAFMAAAASPLAASAMGWPVVWGHMYA